MWTNRKTWGITILLVLATLVAGCGGTPIIGRQAGDERVSIGFHR